MAIKATLSFRRPIDRPGLRPYLELVRLPGTFTAWSNILAAHLIATQASPQWGLLLLQLGITTALFWSGMTLNDCFDRDRDALERPERPIPSGQVPVRAAWALGFGLMTLGLALAALAGGGTLGAAGALAVSILAYNGLLKGGLLGPLAMGVCRYANWSLGLAAAPTAVGLWVLALPVLLYTAAITVLSGAETEGADRRTVRIFLAVLALAALALAALVFSGQLGEPLALIPLLFALYPLIRAVRRMTADGGPGAVRALVGLLLLGMIPLDALLLFGSGHWILALALLTLALPGRLLARRIRIT